MNFVPNQKWLLGITLFCIVLLCLCFKAFCLISYLNINLKIELKQIQQNPYFYIYLCGIHVILYKDFPGNKHKIFFCFLGIENWNMKSLHSFFFYLLILHRLFCILNKKIISILEFAINKYVALRESERERESGRKKSTKLREAKNMQIIWK